MMNPDTTKLFFEVNQLHAANIVNAEKTAENAIQIGVFLHQIKETIGHGEFLGAMESQAPNISRRCSQNYMRLASERLVEEKARLLIPDSKNATVAHLPAEGKNATVAFLAPLPANSIPSECYDLARKQVDEMSWLELPRKTLHSLVKNIRGKDLMELYRDYGVVRAKELKVYHPPKPLTPDDQVEAENKYAQSLLSDAEQTLDVILMDLGNKTLGVIAPRIGPARIKEFLRKTVAVNKALRPLAKRKLSTGEKRAAAGKAEATRRIKAARRAK